VRNADDERVQRLLERSAAELHRAEKRLGMCDRRRSRERRGDRQLGSERAQYVAPQHVRQRAVEVAERRPHDSRDSFGVVRISAQRPGHRGMVERERYPHDRHAASERPLEGDGEVPALGRRRLEQRIRPGCAQRLGTGGGEKYRRPAVQHGLGCADDDDEVRLGERAVDSERRSRRLVERHELGVLDVVDDDVSVKAAGELRRDERLEVTV
jgi:hypothetical protein